MKRAQLKELMRKIDTDGSGEVDFDEVCTCGVPCSFLLWCTLSPFEFAPGQSSPRAPR